MIALLFCNSSLIIILISESDNTVIDIIDYCKRFNSDIVDFSDDETETAGDDTIELSEDFDESDDADEAVKAAEEAFADDDDDDTDADTDTDDFDEEYLKAFSKSDDSDAE